MSLDERLQHLERLLEVVRGLSTAPDAEIFLQSVIHEAGELTRSELASILEYDPANEELRFITVQWFHRDLLKQVGIPLEGSAAGWVYRHGVPLMIQDTKADNRHYKLVDRISNFETRSLLAVPLIVRGETVGVLEALNKKNGVHYTEEDQTILETLAALAALTVQNLNLQRRIKAASVELADLDRLKTDFIAITSHELRTPLGLILGHAAFLRELIGNQYDEQLDTIIKNATRLKEIIENLADVDNYASGAARVRKNHISLAKIVREVTADFQDEAASRNITLRAELPDGKELFVEADGLKVTLALSNLVKNAVMYTDAGGHVTVGAEGMPGHVKVSVRDDGIGIPAKDLPRVFERFFQVETHLTRRFGGMGLGLSIAKAMIEMHGGRIWAESEEGRGSTFIFILPVMPQPASKSTPAFVTD